MKSNEEQIKSSLAANSSQDPRPEVTEEDIDPANWLERHGDFLFRYALFKLNSHHIAEELVQESFISAIKALESFEKRSSVRTWLKTILHNKIIDHVRKTSRENPVSYEELTLDNRLEHFNNVGIWKSLVPSWGRSPEQILQDKNFSETVQECLRKLPEKLRLVFTMRVIDDIDGADICKELNISSSNFWVMMHRSRLALRGCVEKHWLT